ncbi:MAG: response regulator [Oscillospiraceae bacterium]|nr:response regulator [Oscillospiraceae bacterium]
MYTVAICEDEAALRDEQERICRSILKKLNVEHHISVFDSGTGFWDAFMTGKRYDFILLDIMMDETNGMDLAKKIRETLTGQGDRFLVPLQIVTTT